MNQVQRLYHWQSTKRLRFRPREIWLRPRVKKTVQMGARVLLGSGRLDQPGYFFSPTVPVSVTVLIRGSSINLLTRSELISKV